MLRVALLGFVLPAVSAATALVVFRFLAPVSGERRGPVVALAFGYLVGHLGVVGVPRLPPTESTQALLYLVFAALVVGLVETARPSAVTRWAIRVALLGAVAWMTLRAMIRYEWGPAATGLWLLGLTALGLLLWQALYGLHDRLPALSALAGWICVFAGVGAVLVMSHSALLAQLAWVMMVVLLGLLGVLLVRGLEGALAFGLPVLTTVLFALLLAGTFYTDLEGYRALALALSPLGLVVAELGSAATWSLRRRILLSCIGVMLLLAPVLVPVSLEYAAGSESYDYDYSRY